MEGLKLRQPGALVGEGSWCMCSSLTPLLVSPAPVGIVRDACLGSGGVRVSGFSSSCVETSGKNLYAGVSLSLFLVWYFSQRDFII